MVLVLVLGLLFLVYLFTSNRNGPVATPNTPVPGAANQPTTAPAAQSGTEAYPDATFTLRLSYGAVKGYIEGNDGPTPPGTKLPYFTTIGATFDHAAKHEFKPPYNLPESWMKAKSKLKSDTPFNVVETADIIGGNSGSPVVNTAGEVVGIIFDGNIYSNAWNFAYEDTLGRSIQVDSRGIIEALRTIYGAGALADELMGASGMKAAAKTATKK
jgi:hypothetical protein